MILLATCWLRLVLLNPPPYMGLTLPPCALLCPCLHVHHARTAVTAADGHSYERTEIEAWLRRSSTSPKTGAALASTNLVTAHALRNAIDEWQEANCKLVPRSALAFRDPEDQIGAGSFKRVFRATLRLAGSPRPSVVAALLVRDGDVAAEAAVLLKLGRHPRLVTFIGQCRSTPDPRSDTILITEFAAMGSLDKVSLPVPPPLPPYIVCADGVAPQAPEGCLCTWLTCGAHPSRAPCPFPLPYLLAGD